MSTRICRVQPDVPAVTRAFDYLVPDALADVVTVGTIVRVPLHGRRVRGWVVADDVVPETSVERLVPVHKVASAGPPPSVVDLARWAAHRWAGPVTTFLRAASPPNAVLGPGPGEPESALHPVAPTAVRSSAPTWPDAAVRVVTWPPAADRRALVRSLCAAEGSTLVLVPEPAARRVARACASRRRAARCCTTTATCPDRVRTEVWAATRRGAQVVVGGRAAVWLPFPDLAAVSSSTSATRPTRRSGRRPGTRATSPSSGPGVRGPRSPS